ncbi:hypothetical protein JHK84_055531 [Glycine max]|nr:hypothetical protein JHK84_055531 [Glycine max]
MVYPIECWAIFFLALSKYSPERLNMCLRTAARLIPPHTKQSGIKLDCGLGSSVVKATLVNFYETLRFELKDEVGITIATCGWIGSEMTWGKFMLEEDAEMQWKEEREMDDHDDIDILASSTTGEMLPPCFKYDN